MTGGGGGGVKFRHFCVTSFVDDPSAALPINHIIVCSFTSAGKCLLPTRLYWLYVAVD